MIILLSLALYFTLSLFVEVPFPAFYTNWVNKSVEDRMKNDPTFQLGNIIIDIAKQRDSLYNVNKIKIDSLLHVIDSLKIKLK